MNEEMDVLLSRKTWTLVQPPLEVKLVPCRWVCTIKHNLDGTVIRYKARWVAKDFPQVYGIDYNDIFSLVSKLNTIRVLFFLAINQNWQLHQLGIKNVFLYVDLYEEVYI